MNIKQFSGELGFSEIKKVREAGRTYLQLTQTFDENMNVTLKDEFLVSKQGTRWRPISTFKELKGVLAQAEAPLTEIGVWNDSSDYHFSGGDRKVQKQEVSSLEDFRRHLSALQEDARGGGWYFR